jgi:hypothetical protein
MQNFYSFVKYSIEYGFMGGVHCILRRDGRIIARMFNNGEIEHEDHAINFPTGVQMWNLYAEIIIREFLRSMRYVCRSRAEREEAYKRYVNKARAHYEFCFSKTISDDLLNQVVPYEWVKKGRRASRAYQIK